MYCQSCGQPNDDNAYRCVNCHALLHPSANDFPAPQATYQPPPPNYLVYAILTTLFCCLPAGIVAIVYAAQVDSKAAAGRMTEALEYSKNARTWCWVAFGCGLGIIIIYMCIFFLGMIATIAQHS